ncbi:hypothetical protein GCM10023085_11790 [Actinomadura viridis]|uniref:Cation diffusion facilitator CzcD-associated flavoprotein CzcO n=1 Tax=Actinomadura viridis TaxID=58110 RepID=A0A931DLR6_9ACTN|nr:FAD-dependent oxidoreductase [Actinomadura viridis]MBG6093554.1 cation diffusion facilitator CzcD-associated flavoprotein CzcO [Actinomadura viridis]
MHDSTADALVVGAGPYGLSVAAHLSHLGLDARVIGTPMEFWDTGIPRAAHLTSEPLASSLAAPIEGAAFTDRHPGWRTGRPIPVPTFAGYGRWFAGHLVPFAEDAQVLRIDPARDRHDVLLSTGEVARARAVVVAVGMRPFAHVPPVLSALPAGLRTHSVAHRDLRCFADREVAVIGAGQSALETAVLLADAGARPLVIARTGRPAWRPLPVPSPAWTGRVLRGPHSALGRGYGAWVWSEHPGAARPLPAWIRHRLGRAVLAPAGAWWLRDRFDDRVRLLAGREVVAAREAGGGAVLTTAGRGGDRAEHRVDHVIAATGFVPGLDRIPFLPPEARERIRAERGSPVLGPHLDASVPGLYFAGFMAAGTFGPALRLVHGAGFAARRISAHIAARAAGAARPAEVPAGPPPYAGSAPAG